MRTTSNLTVSYTMRDRSGSLDVVILVSIAGAQTTLLPLFFTGRARESRQIKSIEDVPHITRTSSAPRISDTNSPKKKRRHDRLLRELKFPRNKPQKFQESRDKFCGRTWQDEYARLHEDILRSKKPRRFLVYLCGGDGYGCGGYGNRILSISTLFFLAVLTQRAFLIDWNYNLSLEDYLQPKHVRWNYSLANLEGLAARRHYWGNGLLTEPNAHTVKSVMGNSSTYRHWAASVNYQEYFSYPVEIVTSMWYAADQIWKNPHLSKHMKRLGLPLRDESVSRFSQVGCAFDFLFKKAPRIESYFSDAKKRIGMTTDGAPPFIGLHIRMGDSVFGVPRGRKGALRTRNYKAFFSCAAKFETAIIAANPNTTRDRIKWFLATDDAHVKRTALENYGRFGKFVTLEVKLEHSGLFDRFHSPSDEGMVGALLDNFLLAECDFLVLSRSSFSKTALGLSLHTESAYTYGETCSLPNWKNAI